MMYNQKYILFIMWCLLLAPIITIADHSATFIGSLKSKKESGQKLSPTEALYLKYCLYKKDALDKYECDWKSLISQIGAVEHDMNSKGFTVFVHARCWEWNFLNDIWRLICAVKKHQEEMGDEIALRQREEDCNVAELYEMQKELVKDGAWCDSATDEIGKSSELTFLNRTIFSNWNCFLECTGQYLLENLSIAQEDTALKYAINLLKKYGLEKYIKAVKKLYQVHKKLTDKGELLCVCVKKEYVNKMVYVAKPFGYKYTYGKYPKSLFENVAYHESSVENKEKYYDDGYFGCQIYCAACTDIPGEYGKSYVMKSIHFADSKKYAAYKKQLQDVFVKIKKEMGV